MQIYFSHANGFPAKSYQFFFDFLQPHQVNYINAYGLGKGLEKGFKGRDWRVFSHDLIDLIERNSSEKVVGLGHSFGGAVVYWAAQLRPELFSHVIMLDTPFFGPFRRNAIRIAQWFGLEGKLIPPAKKAIKRRETFPSKEFALEYFREKTLFKNFDPRALADYVEHGLVENQNGVTLLIPAKLEYQIFCASAIRLGKPIEVPSWFVYATKHGVLPQKDLAWNRRYFSKTVFLPFEAGHMFPLEQPEKTAQLVKEIISG
jgi:pimeloyl-ACP methyl ester carboxylesterase